MNFEINRKGILINSVEDFTLECISLFRFRLTDLHSKGSLELWAWPSDEGPQGPFVLLVGVSPWYNSSNVLFTDDKLESLTQLLNQLLNPIGYLAHCFIFYPDEWRTFPPRESVDLLANQLNLMMAMKGAPAASQLDKLMESRDLSLQEIFATWMYAVETFHKQNKKIVGI